MTILAIGIVPKETKADYMWFAKNCEEAGIDTFLNNAEVVFYSDRHKGLPAFNDYFDFIGVFCFRYMSNTPHPPPKHPNTPNIHTNPNQAPYPELSRKQVSKREIPR